MTAYLLTDAAEADLRGIIRYTGTQWGDAQVRSYIAQLERGIGRLAAGEGAFKPLSEIHPALRMGTSKNLQYSSFRRKPESILLYATATWIPAFAGMTA